MILVEGTSETPGYSGFNNCFIHTRFSSLSDLHYSALTRGPADLLLDMGQMRIKPWKSNDEISEIIKFLPSHFQR